MFLWCRRKKSHLVFLQETHSKKEIETQWRNEWGGKILFSHGSSNSAGFDFTLHSVISDPSGRYVIDQTRGRVFPPISKHREVGWKNEAQPSVFLTNFEVFGNRRKHSFDC